MAASVPPFRSRQEAVPCWRDACSAAAGEQAAAVSPPDADAAAAAAAAVNGAGAAFAVGVPAPAAAVSAAAASTGTSTAAAGAAAASSGEAAAAPPTLAAAAAAVFTGAAASPFPPAPGREANSKQGNADCASSMQLPAVRVSATWVPQTRRPGVRVMQEEPTSPPCSCPLHTSEMSCSPVRCCGRRPGLSRPARILSTFSGRCRMALSALALRRIWPPPSSMLPSMCMPPSGSGRSTGAAGAAGRGAGGRNAPRCCLCFLCMGLPFWRSEVSMAILLVIPVLELDVLEARRVREEGAASKSRAQCRGVSTECV